MILKQVIQAAVAAALIAAASSQIPKFIQTMRVAQFKILKESRASKWPQALLPGYQK